MCNIEVQSPCSGPRIFQDFVNSDLNFLVWLRHNQFLHFHFSLVTFHLFSWLLFWFPVAAEQHNYEATRRHFENLVKRYGKPIVILSLLKVGLSTFNEEPRAWVRSIILWNARQYSWLVVASSNLITIQKIENLTQVNNGTRKCKESSVCCICLLSIWPKV